MNKRLLSALLAIIMLLAPVSSFAGAGELTAPAGYDEHDYGKLLAFFETENEDGVKNGDVLFENYDPLDPTSWQGIQWNGTDPKKLLSFYLGRMTAGSLDLSGCEYLSVLIAESCGIPEVNITGCRRLSTVLLAGNELTSIDLTGCISLNKLDISGNDFTSLDLSAAPNLENVNVSGNDLGAVDFSCCRALTHIYCAYCGLSELDLSRNTALYYIEFSGNMIEDIDLTANLRLYALDCSSGLTHLKLSGREVTAVGPGSFGAHWINLSHNTYFRAYPQEGAEFLEWFGDGILCEDGPCHITSNVTVTGQYLSGHYAIEARFAPIPIPGDADMDGIVDIQDALTALRCALRLIELDGRPRENIDMNGDHEITLIDALVILRMALSLI